MSGPVSGSTRLRAARLRHNCVFTIALLAISLASYTSTTAYEVSSPSISPAAVQGVTDAVAAWHAEQPGFPTTEAALMPTRIPERIPAPEPAPEPARVAIDGAAVQADVVRASRGSRGSGGSSELSGSGGPSAPEAVTPRAGTKASMEVLFNKKVWASGFQSEIDACRGAVNVTGRYGVAVIAEHWSCGGSRFPGAGTTVTLSGVNLGTYRVGGIVAVLDVDTDGTASIPRGYDLLYQTCINGSNATMSFTALRRVR